MGKPKIRFKGYEDAWEQRKLDSWGTFYYGRSCPKWSVTEDATIPCIRYGELYTKFGAKIDRVYSYTNMPPENLRFSKGTEVLIPRVGEDPMDYNHCTWLSMPDVAIGEMISVFNTDNNPLFTATMFNATLQNEFAMRVEGGSVTNLYFEKLKNIEVSFPSIQEQEKIAAYFENLDHLITLHQRKCEETKSLKKYMLQKMFPENGKCVPEIRFSGFSDAWEQRKLGEIYGSIGNAFVGTATPYYVEQGHFYLESNNVKDGQINHNSEIFINDEFYEKQKDKWLHTGDVVMVQSGHVGHAAVIPKELNNTVAHALIMFRNPKEEIEPYFLNYEYQTDKVKKKIENITTGNTIKHILASDMQEFVVDVPKYEEQKVIASYFSHLDHLITLHQRKCYRFIDIALDAWEQRKLGEMIKEYKETVDSDCILPVLTSSKTEGVILQEEHFGRKQQHDITGYNILPRNYCTYRNRSDGVDFTFNINKCCDKGIISKFYPVFSGNNSDVFFISLLLNNSDEIVQEIAYTCTGTGQKVLSFLDLQKMKIKVPNFEEQKKIAAYFDHLDHLITLHQHKCDELQKLKKFMLQNMFV